MNSYEKSYTYNHQKKVTEQEQNLTQWKIDFEERWEDAVSTENMNNAQNNHENFSELLNILPEEAEEERNRVQLKLDEYGDILEKEIREKNENSKVVKNNQKSYLDRVYLGKNLFHNSYGGWGHSTITKKAGEYLIKGEHKMPDGDWVKIEGKILEPSIEGFTFEGKILAYSPSETESLNSGEYSKKGNNKIHGDTCIWSGKTKAYKLFEDRKYWRIKFHDCYSYTTDIDVFHN